MTAGEIRGLDFRTKAGDLHLKVTGTDRTVTHMQGSERGEAWEISKRFHRELADAIEYSRTRADLVKNIQEVANRWLPNGVADLPKGLRGAK